ALTNQLRDVVTSLCQSSVSVTKVDGDNNPIGGHPFSGHVNIVGALTEGYTWTDPASGGTVPNSSTDTPVTVLTAPVTGTANFQWKPAVAQRSARFFFSETVPAGWM